MDKTKLEAGANYKFKLKHNSCTTEEDHQNDFETDSAMTTAIDKLTQVDRARSCVTS